MISIVQSFLERTYSATMSCGTWDASSPFAPDLPAPRMAGALARGRGWYQRALGALGLQVTTPFVLGALGFCIEHLTQRKRISSGSMFKNSVVLSLGASSKQRENKFMIYPASRH